MNINKMFLSASGQSGKTIKNYSDLIALGRQSEIPDDHAIFNFFNFNFQKAPLEDENIKNFIKGVFESATEKYSFSPETFADIFTSMAQENPKVLSGVLEKIYTTVKTEHDRKLNL